MELAQTMLQHEEYCWLAKRRDLWQDQQVPTPGAVGAIGEAKPAALEFKPPDVYYTRQHRGGNPSRGRRAHDRTDLQWIDECDGDGC